MALLLIAFPIVASPLRNKSQPKTLADRQNDNRHQSNYESALLAIRDLDFDYWLDMISEDDYTLLRQQYLVEAAEAHEQSTPAEGDLEQHIETAISNRRQHIGNGQGRCENCGADQNVADKFCAACGFQARRACPDCSQLIKPGANFCTSCGTQVAVASGASI
jgi:RNA polymerase subunit RPABC4/transcription elongation factor Spt4